MGTYQWYLTKEREQLKARAEKILRREGKDLSTLLEEQLIAWLQKHERTHNPQTAIEDFEDPRFRALPNIWLLEKPSDLKGFESATLEQIMKHAGQVAYMASKRLEARGEG